MPKKKKSGTSSSGPRRKKHSVFGRRLLAGVKEMAAHMKGEIELPSYEIHVPSDAEVARIRRRLGLSQAAFARAFGLDITAVHAWEQGRRRPDRAARILLAVIAKEPMAVRRALAA